MKHVIPFTAMIWIFLFLLPVAAPILPAQAQEDQAVELQKRITDLENRIRDLEKSLKECADRGKKGGPDTYGWQNKMNWRKLEPGMPQDQVEAILGEPIKIIKGYRTLWYYPNIYCGYVSFDESGRLSGWSEP